MEESGFSSTQSKLLPSKIAQLEIDPSVLLVCAAVAAIVTEPFTDALLDGDVTVTSIGDPDGLVTAPPEELPPEPEPELEPELELEPEPELEPELPPDGV
jgi:hypothetical protein